MLIVRPPSPYKRRGLTFSNLATRVGMKYFFLERVQLHWRGDCLERREFFALTWNIHKEDKNIYNAFQYVHIYCEGGNPKRGDYLKRGNKYPLWTMKVMLTNVIFYLALKKILYPMYRILKLPIVTKRIFWV